MNGVILGHVLLFALSTHLVGGSDSLQTLRSNRKTCRISRNARIFEDWRSLMSCPKISTLIYRTEEVRYLRYSTSSVVRVYLEKGQCLNKVHYLKPKRYTPILTRRYDT